MPKKTAHKKKSQSETDSKHKLKTSPQKKAFGDRLKQLRDARGLQQGALAKELGMHVQSISRFERGLIDPVMSSLMTIASYFNVSIDWLTNYSAMPYSDEFYLKVPYIDNDNYWVADRSFLKSLTDETNIKAFSVRNNSLHPLFQRGDVILVSMDKLPATDKYVLILAGSEYVLKRVVGVSQDGGTVQLATNTGAPLEVPADAIAGVVESFSRGYL